MNEDLDHYDVVDSNCHHTVQNAWNKAVQPGAQDRSPAPDDAKVKSWEGFLRRWAQKEDRKSLEEEAKEEEEAAEARMLSDNDTDADGFPLWNRSRGPSAWFTTHGV